MRELIESKVNILNEVELASYLARHPDLANFLGKLVTTSSIGSRLTLRANGDPAIGESLSLYVDPGENYDEAKSLASDINNKFLREQRDVVGWLWVWPGRPGKEING